MSNPQPKLDKDEIDLDPLIKWILSIGSKTSKVFNNFKQLLKRQQKFIFISTFLGVLAGLAVYFFAPKTYSSNLQLIGYHSLNRSTFNSINNLQVLAFDKSYGNLSKELNIPIEVSNKIKNIEYLNNDYQSITGIDGDTVIENKPFFIYVETSSFQSFSLLQKELINYLNNQPLTIETRENRKNKLAKKIEWTVQELSKLDSLKKLAAKNAGDISSMNGILFSDPIQPIEVFKESERLFDNYLWNKEELENLKSYKVVSNFVVSEKPAFPRFRVVIQGALIFLGLGLILGIVRDLIFR